MYVSFVFYNEFFLVQDDLFPWFHIIQWSCETLKEDFLLKWHLPAIKSDVDSILASPSQFVKACPSDELLAFSAFDESSVYMEWYVYICHFMIFFRAESLLHELPTLASLRFKLVPVKMSESQFWQRFFCGLRILIQTHIKSFRYDDSEDESSKSELQSKIKIIDNSISIENPITIDKSCSIIEPDPENSL